MSSERSREELEELFSFLSPRDRPRRADLIIGFGVFDMRVPAHCAELYHGGYAPLILFTGGIGAGSGPLEKPEAVMFGQAALEAGVPESSVLMESTSKNTLENVLNSKMLLTERGVHHERAIVVAQPHRQRRVWLTCRKWLPRTEFINCPPHSTLEAEKERLGGDEAYHAAMVGELERIVNYGRADDILAEEIPRRIMDIGMPGIF
jgi:uncharacterized SAM-binding protein YcdF (DUF218 family)